MRKIWIALATLAFCGVAIASSKPLFSPAAPQKGHGGGPGSPTSGFTGASTGINSSGFVYVTFKDVVGKNLAGTQQEYSFTASGAANWVCSMGGGGKGKHQATGAPVTTDESSYITYQSFTVPNNGTVSGGAAIPPAAAPSTGCSGTWELGAVSYLLPPGSLTNTTGGYTADSVMTGTCVIGSQCSRVFISGVSAPTAP